MNELAVERLVRALLVCLMNGLLYFPGHRRVKESAEDAVRVLDDYFDEHPEMSFHVREGLIVFEGTPFYDLSIHAHRLIRALQDHGGRGLRFEPGVTEDEIIALVELLLGPNLETTAESNRRLGAAGAERIALTDKAVQVFGERAVFPVRHDRTEITAAHHVPVASDEEIVPVGIVRLLGGDLELDLPLHTTMLLGALHQNGRRYDVKHVHQPALALEGGPGPFAAFSTVDADGQLHRCGRRIDGAADDQRARLAGRHPRLGRRLRLLDDGSLVDNFLTPLGQYVPGQPFRCRIIVNLEDQNWDFLLDDELNGFGDDALVEDLEYVNDPSVVPDMAKASASLGNSQGLGARAAYDDIHIETQEYTPAAPSSWSSVKAGY